MYIVYRIQDHHPAIVHPGVTVITADGNQLWSSRIHCDAFGLCIFEVVVQTDQAYFAVLADVRLPNVELTA